MASVSATCPDNYSAAVQAHNVLQRPRCDTLDIQFSQVRNNCMLLLSQMINSHSRRDQDCASTIYFQHSPFFPIAKQLRATVASCAPTTSQLNIDIAELRGGSLSTRLQIFKVATQNVEGLTGSKEVELVVIMQACGIGVLCIQETHRKESCVRELCNGFLLILSGWDTNDINYAGVGFIIAPHVRRSIITYCLKSARICMLKLRTFKGKIAIVSAYAPPQTPKHSALERQAYFQELSKFWSDTSCNGPKLIAGDFNSRLYARLTGEEQIIGPNIIAKPGKSLHAHMNRFQLLQLCHDANLQIMNTFTQHELPDLVTYHEIWFDKNSPVTASTNHELLDLLLVPQAVTQAYQFAFCE